MALCLDYSTLILTSSVMHLSLVLYLRFGRGYRFYMVISACTFAINTYSITIIQLLKITGTYDTMQEAAGETVVQSSSISMLLTLAMLLGVSIGFMSLVYLCIKKMAQHNGRWEYIVNDVKSFRVQEMLRQNSQFLSRRL